jgi:hypothetical protein
MGRACSTYGRDEIFWLENVKGRDTMEDVGTGGRINNSKLYGVSQ